MAVRVICWGIAYRVFKINDDYDNDLLMLSSHLNLIIGMIFYTFHLHNFNNQQRGHQTFSIGYFLLIIGTSYINIFGLEKHENGLGVLITTVLGVFVPFVFVMNMTELSNTEHIQKMYKQIHDQKFLKLVLDTHSEGILVLNEKCQISFANSEFSTMFQSQIDHAVQ